MHARVYSNLLPIILLNLLPCDELGGRILKILYLLTAAVSLVHKKVRFLWRVFIEPLGRTCVSFAHSTSHPWATMLVVLSNLQATFLLNRRHRQCCRLLIKKILRRHQSMPGLVFAKLHLLLSCIGIFLAKICFFTDHHVLSQALDIDFVFWTFKNDAFHTNDWAI